jgi:hypothetical protein
LTGKLQHRVAMATPITTHFLTEAQYDSWNALVAASPQGSIYSTPQYLEAFCAASGGTYRILAVTRGQDLAGGVALYEQRDERGLRLAPRPLLYYNGLVLREYETKYPSQHTARVLEVTQAIAAALSQTSYASITLKNRSTLTDARSFIAQGWTVRPGYTYVVQLGDLKLGWERVEQNLRRLINRCTRDGMLFTEDDDVESFFRMHRAMTERKGTSVYLPEPAFKRFFTVLRAQNLCRLFHSRLPTGQSISAQLVLLGNHGVSHSVSAAADSAYLNTGATAFLRWKVFEAVAALGYSANDLTDAALNPVTHFKSQLGGDLELCLILERAQAPRTLPQRLKSAVLAYAAAPFRSPD